MRPRLPAPPPLLNGGDRDLDRDFDRLRRDLELGRGEDLERDRDFDPRFLAARFRFITFRTSYRGSSLVGFLFGRFCRGDPDRRLGDPDRKDRFPRSLDRSWSLLAFSLSGVDDPELRFRRNRRRFLPLFVGSEESELLDLDLDL